MLTETINQEAMTQNLKPVADFFRMHGEDTAATYSNTILEMIDLVYQDEMNNPRRSEEELADLIFELKELNKLVVSLKAPTNWVSE